MGGWLDWVILWVFSNCGDSRFYEMAKKKKGGGGRKANQFQFEVALLFSVF